MSPSCAASVFAPRRSHFGPFDARMVATTGQSRRRRRAGGAKVAHREPARRHGCAAAVAPPRRRQAAGRRGGRRAAGVRMPRAPGDPFWPCALISRASATDAQRESSRSGTRGPVRDPMMSDEAILRTGRPGRTSSATKKCRIRHRFRPQDNRADHHAGTFRASGATAPPSETRTDIGRTIAASEMTDGMGYAPHSSPTPLSNIRF